MDTAAASKPRLWRRLFNAVGMGWEVPPIAMDDDPRCWVSAYDSGMNPSDAWAEEAAAAAPDMDTPNGQ